MGIFSCIFSSKQEELLNKLIFAIKQNDLSVVRWVIAEDSDAVNWIYNGGSHLGYYRRGYPLDAACCFNRVECAALLIKSGADVNRRYGAAPLHYAAKNGNLELMKLLLEHGADVNFRDINHASPMCLASYAGHAQIVKFLLKNGADVNVTDRNGDTSLCVARTRGHNKVVDLLERFLDEQENLLGYPNIDLFVAVENGYLEMVTYLLEVGADINVVNSKYGSPVLHLAVGKGWVEVVELLLKKGADVNAVNAYIHTPLRVAKWFLERRNDCDIELIARIEKIAELLKQHGAIE